MSNGLSPTPTPFLQVRVHKLDLEPGLTGLCAGYELGEWQDDKLAGHLMRWLPDFALKHSEKEAMNSGVAVEMIQQAARNIFLTPDLTRRGEFGELLLHVAIRQCFGSVPAISKIFYKDGPNETVKGFDAVHVVVNKENLELWLGEVKFYEDVSTAISHVVKELAEHTGRDYLREEFQAITRKIDPTWPHSGKLRKLIDSNTSLDDIFQSLCIPVLLTYNSPCVSSFNHVCDDYKRRFEEEVLKHHKTFSGKNLPKNLRVHLFLMPLKSKVDLVQKLYEKLRAWQSIA